jgi:hypothetical protein
MGGLDIIKSDSYLALMVPTGALKRIWQKLYLSEVDLNNGYNNTYDAAVSGYKGTV